jgi:hypothetical protein
MVLIFKHKTKTGNKYKKSIVGKPKDQDESSKMINDILKKRNFTPHNFRMWTKDFGGYDVTTIDFGSHTEFFYLVDEEHAKELLKS